MSAMTFRNRQGEWVDIPRVAASRFKNEFGAIFEQAALGGAVAITKHDAPKAVLLSYAEFESLIKSRAPALDDLSAQFDSLLARMQTPKAVQGMARGLPLRRCESLEELEEDINAVLEGIDWGWSRIAESGRFIEIVHGAYPIIPQDETRRSWVVPRRRPPGSADALWHRASQRASTFWPGSTAPARAASAAQRFARSAATTTTPTRRRAH